MSGERAAFVEETELVLAEGVDPAAAGAAVTVALCGHWEHEGPCRWPHHTGHVTVEGRTIVTTLFVCAPDEEPEVRSRVADALRDADGWTVEAARSRAVAPDERAHADRLIADPRPA